VKELIARRAARLLKPGWVVNLGIGIPTLVSKYVDEGVVFLHSENGILGVGPPPTPAQLDVNLIDAGKRPITVQPGASYFDSAQSFAMIRGGHVDAAVLGALQVDGQGIIANWAIPGELVLGVGGAMDLLSGVRSVIVVMSHTTREGEPKIVRELTLPKSSIRPADHVVTDLATFRVKNAGLVLEELAEDVSIDTLREKTAAPFHDGRVKPRAT
jgi:3-oxoacid CoA-transferase B subunit